MREFLSGAVRAQQLPVAPVSSIVVGVGLIFFCAAWLADVLAKGVIFCHIIVNCTHECCQLLFQLVKNCRFRRCWSRLCCRRGQLVALCCASNIVCGCRWVSHKHQSQFAWTRKKFAFVMNMRHAGIIVILLHFFPTPSTVGLNVGLIRVVE